MMMNDDSGGLERDLRAVEATIPKGLSVMFFSSKFDTYLELAHVHLRHRTQAFAGRIRKIFEIQD